MNMRFCDYCFNTKTINLNHQSMKNVYERYEPRSNKHGRKRSYTEEYGSCIGVYERIRIP